MHCTYLSVCLFVLADWLTALFKKQMGLGNKADSEVEKLLEKPDFDGIVQFMKSDRCKHIITMAGAGISTCMYLVLVFCV